MRRLATRSPKSTARSPPRSATCAPRAGRVRRRAWRRKRCCEARMAGLKSDVLDLQGRSIQYNILKREAETNRQLYDGLLQRYKEIGVAGGVGANNISVVDRATVPDSPHSPRLALQPGGGPAARRLRSACCWRSCCTTSTAVHRRRRWKTASPACRCSARSRAWPRAQRRRRRGRPALAVRRGLPLGAHRAAVRHRARPAAQPADHQRRSGGRQVHHGAWSWRATSRSSASAW